MKLSYLSSKTKSIKGKIKESSSDFSVEEILPDGTILELNKPIKQPDTGTKFLCFVLQKEGWSTLDAVRKIASKFHISPERINYAGIKDKQATTTQLLSVHGIKNKDLQDLKINGIKILGSWYSNKKIGLGSLMGNRFRIAVKGKINKKIVNEIINELDYKFPNYFGLQRFGVLRSNTHLIGKKLVQNDLRGVVETYLMDYEKETNNYAKQARKQLCEDNDYKKALRYFPKHLKFERTMLFQLAEHPQDFKNALSKLPKRLLLLFVHAFQAHLFNIMLSERIAEGRLKLEEGEYYCREKFGFPDLKDKSKKGWIVGKIIGYETKLNKREKEILERSGIKKQDFKIKEFPQISSKGAYRTLLAPIKNFTYMKNTFEFSLPAGSYATSALREWIKDLW